MSQQALQLIKELKQAVQESDATLSKEEALKVLEICEVALIDRLHKRKVLFCGVFLGCLLKALQSTLDNKNPVIRVSELGLNNREYARFNDLVRFGFASKPSDKSGEYFVDTFKVKGFLKGEIPVSAYFLRLPNSKDFVLSDEKIFVHQVPSVDEVIAEYGTKLTEWIL